MSEQAGQYYQERAERLGIDSIYVPDILDGEPVQLLGSADDQRLSLQQPNHQYLEYVSDGYGRVLHAVDDFVLEAFLKTHDNARIGRSTRQQYVNNRHIVTMPEKRLFPSHLKAGHIKDIQIEAITRQEVPDTYLKKAISTTSYKFYRGESNEDTEAYLLTSAALYAGRQLGYVACLTVVAADHFMTGEDGLLITTKYMAASDHKNDLLARSGLEQSRANRTYIDMWGAANPQLQNVRRGTQQHGQRPHSS